MATINHEYPAVATWTGGREGGGTVRAEHSGVENPINVPVEFQGPGGGTNPEELLVSAIVACYTMTLGIILANRKLPVKSIETAAVGLVEQNGPQFTYKAVTIKPVIAMEGEPTLEQLKLTEDMAHKADGYCIITNAVRGKVEITVEPKIVKG
jgi:peroxiredoxin-like protein